MEAILQTLCDLEGVNGAVVADDRGHIVAYRSHPVYDAALLHEVSRSIATAIDSVKLLQENWESISAQFAEGKLLIRSIPASVRGKGVEHTLSVVADTRLNPSFAGVAIRVAVSKLKVIVEAGTSTPALAVAGGQARSAAGGMSSGALPPAGAASQPRMSIPDVANGGLSWSGFGASSAVSGSGVAAVDAASAAVLVACTKALAKSVGPIAKRYVKEAASRLWPDRPFSKDQIPLLVTELEKRLDDPIQVAEFRKVALKLAT